MQEIFDKIKNKEELDPDEIECLFYIDGLVVDEIHIDNYTWREALESIIKIEDKYYRIEWERGLTECQDNEFYSQVAEEVRPIDEVVTIRKWENVNE